MLFRTFLGFISGALVAALLLQYYRTGAVDLGAIALSLRPTVIGAGIGLISLIVVLGILARNRK